MAGYDDFDWLARRRNAAWVASGLDGTGTQYWTQASANMAAASFYTAGALEGAAAIGISEVGHATSIRCAYTTLWNEAAVVSATGTMFPAAYQRMPSGMPVAQPVTNSKWPPNDGFKGVPDEVTLLRGSVVDRYGWPDGYFVAPQGTPFEARSLPAEYIDRPLMTYEVISDIHGVRAGITAEWFGQPGGGIQFQLPDKVEAITGLKPLQ